MEDDSNTFQGVKETVIIVAGPTTRTSVISGGNGKPMLSLEEEISRLEGKLTCLSLRDEADKVEDGEGQNQQQRHSSSSGDANSIPRRDQVPGNRLGLEFPMSVQNDLRTVFKNVGTILNGEVTPGPAQDLSRIRNILQKPLLPFLQQPLPISDNDADISSVLSYLKLLSEVCIPGPVPQSGPAEVLPNKDLFWTRVIDPIFKGILTFINCHVLKRCIVTLSRTTSTLSESSNGVTTALHHGTGYAFHQQLGLLQKGVRILLVYMKRATSNLTSNSNENSGRKQELDSIISEILLELCTLMKPSRDPEVKTDFDIGLDIRCNIGVGICYSTYYLRHSDKVYIETFFKLIFNPSEDNSSLKSLARTEKEILSLTSSDVNKIALAFGILNTWLEQEHDSNLYFQIGKTVLDIQHGVKEAVNLGSSRVMEVWADKLKRPIVPSSVLQHVVSLFPPLEFFCFMYMPGHIDAVKNCCRNIISALSKIYDRLDDELFPFPDKKREPQKWITNFLQTILEKPAHIKWIALACVAKNTKKALKALELDPELPEDLLTTQRALKSAGSDSYIALMSYHFQNGDLPQWEKTWIDPLFAIQLTLTSESNWPQKKSIISAILNSEKLQLKAVQVMIQPLLVSIVKRMNSGNPGTPSKKNISAEEPDEKFAEASLLAVETIKMAHDLKISISSKKLNVNVTEPEEDSFRGLVPRSVLHDWLWSENHQIRLAGLSLIVETKKTTEEISEQDFDSLKIFLKYNLHSQNPAFRQQFMSYFKKFVRRLKDGESSTRRKKNEDAIQRYQGFLRWFWNFLTEEEGLFVGANFGRRCQSLECLAELTQYFPDFKIFGVSDSGNLKYLRWLTDSYENNKIEAMRVLTTMPMKEFQDEQFCKNLFDEAVTLSKSVKPPDSITGRYVMTLLMHKCAKVSNANVNISYSPFAILGSLYSELEEICEKVSSTSLILVASESPMYGCLRCIRMILQNTKDYKLAENTSKYQEYVSKLLKLCFTVDDILFPVLGSAAPEGFLPGLKDSAPEENKQIVRSITAQMLLVCAWRSMKEVCLLMADMCTWFQIEGETSKTSSSNYLLTYQQVSAIGDHLLFLLKNLMHRGVFEQVFVGFKQLSSRLWKSSSPSLNHLPEKWLQEAIDQEHISSKSITRRSAGLPFIFQALLSAECDNEPFLHKWVQRLLIHDENPDVSPIRIHSMNVLRGLFRDASFSAAMMPFVPQGLKMAFRGLKSADWTERNSGLMLYGAVMRRSFGAKLNLMNAPTFFRKFPQMYDFLLEELDICIKLMEIRQSERDTLKSIAESSDKPQLTCDDFTFHLLLLLSAFTSCCRVEDTHFKLEAFIPRIRKCSSSDDIEVRKLSARALVPFLVSPEDKRELMMKILTEMESTIEQLSQNQLHGELCQFLTISSHLPHEDSQVCKDANAKIATAFLSFLSSSAVPKSFRVPPVFATLMSILSSFNSLQCLPKGLVLNRGVNIVSKTYEKLFGHCLHRSVIPGLPVADKTIANATIQIMMDNLNPEVFMEFIYNYFTDSSMCSRPYIDEFLELCQEDNRVHKVLFCERTGGTDSDNNLVIIEAIIENYLKRTSSEFQKYPATTSELNYLKFLEAVSPLVFADIDEETIKSLISRLFQLCDEGELIECTSLQIRAAGYRILGNLIFTTGIPVSQKYQTMLCDMAVTWSCSTADDDMRDAIAESYPDIPFPNMNQFSVVNQAKLWSSIFMLAQDDESYIREIINIKLTASTTGKAVCDRKSLEILTSLFFKHFLVHNPLEGLIVLLGLLQRSDFEYEVKADDETEDRLFDKSEMNMYFEDQILAKVIVSEIAEGENRHALKGKDLMTEKLTPDRIRLYYFLLNMQSVDSVSSDSSTSLSSLCSKTEHANTAESSSGRKIGIVSAIIDNASSLDKKCVQDILHALDLSKHS